MRHPTLNDRELSEKVQVKLSTVTAIKNRLKARALFLTVRVPQLQHLGCELVSVNYAHLNLSTPAQKRLEVGRALVTDFPDVFYLGADERIGFALSLNRNYSAAKENVERFFRLYSENEILLGEGYASAYFPFVQSRIYNTFECASLLAREFAIEEEAEKRRAAGEGGEPFEAIRPVELSRVEKKVYRGLIANPDLLDSSVAKQIDVTRQTVTRMRKRFEAAGLIKTVRVPNLQSLGYEVLACFHEHYRPSETLAMRRSAEEPFFAKLPVVWRVASDTEAFEILVFKSFEEYLKTSVAMSRFNREHKHTAREPMALVFSLKEMHPVKNHVYARAVDRVLGLDGG